MKRGRPQFGRIPLWIAGITLGGERAWRVLTVVASCADKDTWLAYPSERFIAEATGIKRRKIQDLLAALVRAGALRKVGIGPNRATQYLVCLMAPQTGPSDGPSHGHRMAPHTGTEWPLTGVARDSYQTSEQTNEQDTAVIEDAREEDFAADEAESRAAAEADRRAREVDARAAFDRAWEKAHPPSEASCERPKEGAEAAEEQAPPLTPSPGAGTFRPTYPSRTADGAREAAAGGFVVIELWHGEIQHQHGPFDTLEAAQAEVVRIYRGGFPSYPPNYPNPGWRIEFRDPAGAVLEASEPAPEQAHVSR